MILRRIVEFLRNREWSILVLEVTVVVIGVFIGLQVDDWNQSRQDRNLESVYLARLHTDAIAAVERQERAEVWNDTRIQDQDIVLAALRSGVLPDDQRARFGRGLALAGIPNPLIWRWGVVEELYATGNIGLLQDTELLDRIAEAETEYRRSVEIVEFAEQQISLSRSQITQLYLPVEYGFRPDDEAQVEFDFDDLSSNPQFIATFANLHLNSRIIVSFVEAHLEMLKQLESEIANARGVEPLVSNDKIRD